MSDEMKVIVSREWVGDDGTKYKLTISTQGGGEISDEDKAFIARFLPLAAGTALDALNADADGGES